MLSSLVGIRLVLWLGAQVPGPAPYELTQALSAVEVTNGEVGGDGFSLTFTLQKGRQLDYALLSHPHLTQPGSRVIIGVILGVKLEVLIDGVTEHYQVSLNAEPQPSTLTVTGRDLTARLDLTHKDTSFRQQSASAIVRSLLSQPEYGTLGLQLQVTPTTDRPLESERIPWQQGTDLDLIQMLAWRYGYVFYLEPLTFRQNLAYWGPKQAIPPIAQPALSVNLGEATNVQALSFREDTQSPVEVATKCLDPNTGEVISIPSPQVIRIPPTLAARPIRAQRQIRVRDAAHLTFEEAWQTAQGMVASAPDPIQGNGEVDTVRYGHILRAHRLVGVRGAGLSYDGDYWVNSVTHHIQRGQYTQSFSISREGIGTLTGRVRP